MNENIDLTKILKNCPKGTELYSPMCGPVSIVNIYSDDVNYPIETKSIYGHYINFTKEGHCFNDCPYAEIMIYPSATQRDWSKFTAPWYKKDKFNPKTLKPFDKVLVSDEEGKYEWTCKFFSHYRDYKLNKYRYTTTANVYKYCIPYNDDTKQLVGTKDEAPEYYRYWED